MEEIKVSIIVPVYNVEKYLHKCLDSILNQTLEEVEVLCIDDGSSDASGQILDFYSIKDARVKVFHNENHGYGYSINFGIKNARGNYIGIVESDDSIRPQMYETLYEIAQKENLDFIKSDYFQYYKIMNEKEIYQYTATSDDNKYYNKLITDSADVKIFAWQKYNWTGLYNTKFLNINGLFCNETPGASYQDVGFWFKILVKAKRFYILKEAFYNYCVDNPGASIRNKSNYLSLIEEFEHIYEFLNEEDMLGSIYEEYWRFFYVFDYLGSFVRLADESRKLAVQKAWEIMLKFISQKKFPIEYLGTLYQSEFFRILCDPNKYSEQYGINLNNKFSRLDKDRAIVCYGAGEYCKKALEFLGTGNLLNRLYGVAVTELTPGTSFFEIPIFEIKDLVPKKDEIIIIVAVSTKYISEMVGNVKELGFDDYITIDQLI